MDKQPRELSTTFWYSRLNGNPEILLTSVLRYDVYKSVECGSSTAHHQFKRPASLDLASTITIASNHQPFHYHI